MSLTDKEIAKTVGMEFLRACKRHDLFTNFLKKFSKTKNAIFCCIGVAPNGNDVTSIQQMFDINLRMSDYVMSQEKNFNGGGIPKYDRIVIMTNNLIKYYLDCDGGLRKIRPEELGKEIFEASCLKIYGNEFLDMIKKEKESFNDKNFANWTKQQYSLFKKRGYDGSFERFLNDFGSALADAYRLPSKIKMFGMFDFLLKKINI